jgi:hypothetical protein
MKPVTGSKIRHNVGKFPYLRHVSWGHAHVFHKPILRIHAHKSLITQRWTGSFFSPRFYVPVLGKGGVASSLRCLVFLPILGHRFQFFIGTSSRLNQRCVQNRPFSCANLEPICLQLTVQSLQNLKQRKPCSTNVLRNRQIVVASGTSSSPVINKKSSRTAPAKLPPNPRHSNNANFATPTL